MVVYTDIVPGYDSISGELMTFFLKIEVHNEGDVDISCLDLRELKKALDRLDD